MKEHRQALFSLLDSTRNEYILRRRHTETQHSFVNATDLDLENGPRKTILNYSVKDESINGYLSNSADIEFNLDRQSSAPVRRSGYSKKSTLNQSLLNNQFL